MDKKYIKVSVWKIFRYKKLLKNSVIVDKTVELKKDEIIVLFGTLFNNKINFCIEKTVKSIDKNLTIKGFRTLKMLIIFK